MVRILCGCIVLQVATDTVAAGSLEIAADVTRRAVKSRVNPGEGKARESRVIKRCAHPTIHGVALLAGRGESGGSVVRDRRLNVRLGMASDALCRKACKLAGRRALMAGIAGHRGVRTHQRKTVLMVADRLERDLPSQNGVALLALRSKLPAVNIGVAVRAFGADLRKDQAYMALRAGNLLMKSAKGVGGLVVVKLRNAAEGLPSREGMAVFTRDVQCAMGAARRTPLAALPSGQEPRTKHDKNG